MKILFRFRFLPLVISNYVRKVPDETEDEEEEETSKGQ